MAKKATVTVSKSTETEIMQAATAPANPKPAAPARPKAAPMRNARPAPEKPAVKVPGSAKVAYHPRVDGDMPFTVFMGVRFVANVAKVVTNPELIKKAMGNPWFSVDGKSTPMPKLAKPRDTSEDVSSLDNEKTEAKEVEVAETLDDGYQN